MFGHQPFYWSHIRKYIVLMGTLLNDISINRKVNGKETTVKVPISFSQKNKILDRLLSNPELRNQWKAILPRIGFEMHSPIYAPDRKDNTNNLHGIDSTGQRRTMQQPCAPYDIPFTVYVWTEYYEDSLQIVEQILPFFQPSYCVFSKEVPELDLKRDIHVSLTSVTQNDDYEGDYEGVRFIEWQFEFMLKGYFYGPIEERKIIKKTLTNFLYTPDEFSDDSNVLVSTHEAEVSPFEADRDDPHEIIERKTNYE